jgi:hypothetical protein
VRSDNGTNVTLSIVSGTGTPGATLTCNANPVATVGGTATFAGCKIDKSFATTRPVSVIRNQRAAIHFRDQQPCAHRSRPGHEAGLLHPAR